MQTHHTDVTIVTGSIDEKLNESGYIVPGLGDAATGSSQQFDSMYVSAEFSMRTGKVNVKMSGSHTQRIPKLFIEIE